MANAMAKDAQTAGGKSKGLHPDKKLTAVMVRRAGPGRHADGAGLYLVVDPSGACRWLLRRMAQGKRWDIGLGGAQTVTLAMRVRPPVSFAQSPASAGIRWPSATRASAPCSDSRTPRAGVCQAKKPAARILQPCLGKTCPV